MTGNREYKSDVFSMLLENPQNALDLYNAVNNSEYTDSNLVEMCALDKGISLTVRYITSITERTGSCLKSVRF